MCNGSHDLGVQLAGPQGNGLSEINPQHAKQMQGSDDFVGLNAEFTIDRGDFGVRRRRDSVASLSR
jgi:hypothetical protein